MCLRLAILFCVAHNVEFWTTLLKNDLISFVETAQNSHSVEFQLTLEWIFKKANELNLLSTGSKRVLGNDLTPLMLSMIMLLLKKILSTMTLCEKSPLFQTLTIEFQQQRDDNRNKKPTLNAFCKRKGFQSSLNYCKNL